MKNMPSFNRNTIKRKLIVLIGGQLLLFIIVLYGVFFWFQHILESKVSALAEQTLRTVTGNIEIHLHQQTMLTNAIASDSDLNQLLRSNPDFGDSASIWPQVQLIQMMKTYTAGDTSLYSVSIYNPSSGRILSTVDGSVSATHAMKEWVIDRTSTSFYMEFHVDIDGESPLLSGNSSMMMLIRKLPGREQDNFLMVNTNKQTLHQMIGEVEQWQGTEIVLTDSEGRVLLTSGNHADLLKENHVLALPHDDQAGVYKTVKIEGNSYITVQQNSSLTGWNITMLIPQQEIMQDVVQMKEYATILIIVIGVFFAIMSVLLYTQIFNPIKSLIERMVMVEKGMPPEPLEIKRYDELGYLQKKYNDMIHNEQQMRETIIQEQLHKKEIELKLLQSQMNPHFLYNTLDSIYWVAVENNAEEISDVVLDLSRYFRLSLSRGKEYVTIGEAIDHLVYYLRIQQFKHTGKFEVRWNVDPALKEIRIMKLMLQPIVENAIIHGVERSEGFCYLHIDVQRHKGCIRFRIEDTGAGIERVKLKMLLHDIKRLDGLSPATYGLQNLYQRLQLKYGEGMHYAMSSMPGIGTRVTISIHESLLKRGE